MRSGLGCAVDASLTAMVPEEGFEPPTTRLRTAALYPLSYTGKRLILPYQQAVARDRLRVVFSFVDGE